MRQVSSLNCRWEFSNDDAITETILAMSWRLGFQAIAEGVETDEQLNFLKARQCDGYQGYLFSPPVPAGDFEQILYQSLDAGV